MATVGTQGVTSPSKTFYLALFEGRSEDVKQHLDNPAFKVGVTQRLNSSPYDYPLRIVIRGLANFLTCLKKSIAKEPSQDTTHPDPNPFTVYNTKIKSYLDTVNLILERKFDPNHILFNPTPHATEANEDSFYVRSEDGGSDGAGEGDDGFTLINPHVSPSSTSSDTQTKFPIIEDFMGIYFSATQSEQKEAIDYVQQLFETLILHGANFETSTLYGKDRGLKLHSRLTQEITMCQEKATALETSGKKLNAEPQVLAFENAIKPLSVLLDTFETMHSLCSASLDKFKTNSSTDAPEELTSATLVLTKQIEDFEKQIKEYKEKITTLKKKASDLRQAFEQFNKQAETHKHHATQTQAFLTLLEQAHAKMKAKKHELPHGHTSSDPSPTPIPAPPPNIAPKDPIIPQYTISIAAAAKAGATSDVTKADSRPDAAKP